MRKMIALCAISALAAAACVGCGSGQNNNTAAEPSEAVSATAAPSAEPAKEPTGTPTPIPSATGMPTQEPEVSPTATPTPTPQVNEDGMTLLCPSDAVAIRKEAIYGKFEHGTYHSEYCGRDRGYTVLLPVNYTEEKKYPVVYLLHGIFGDENSFAGDASNRIVQLVGNMIADGACDEFILVCPAMFAASDETAQQPGFTAEAMIPYDRFPTELTQCLIPHINATYSVAEGRDNTYIAGFSMGGRETLYTILSYPQYFRMACAIAPAPGLVPGKDNFMVHEGSLTDEQVVFAEDAVVPEKILICCGTRDSVVGKFPLSYHNLFTSNGIAHLWYEVPGADHDNRAIQSGLYNFLRLIGGSAE
ncbi:MAG: hypothetical protein IJM57_03540 [Lachnospiraceae bacterium]|nr:hypothetical protein [Lachnospiraceae bacterium]